MHLATPAVPPALVTGYSDNTTAADGPPATKVPVGPLPELSADDSSRPLEELGDADGRWQLAGSGQGQ